MACAEIEVSMQIALKRMRTQRTHERTAGSGKHAQAFGLYLKKRYKQAKKIAFIIRT